MSLNLPVLEDKGELISPQPTRKGQSSGLGGLASACALFLLLAVATELISYGLLPSLQWYLIEKPKAGNAHSGYYKDKAWATRYWQEVNASNRFSFAPYIYWRRKPFTGQYVNVDGHGLRQTINPTCSPSSRQIWMFGGSSLWGTGSKDDETIPSFVSKLYGGSVSPVCVTNFGEAGWVNTQEVLQLEMALKHSGNRPDLVLFYDGFGDVYAAYQSGSEDLPVDFGALQRKVEGNNDKAGFTYLEGTNTYRLMGLLTAEILRLQRAREKAVELPPPPGLDRDSRMVVDNYLENMKLVQALSAQYHFQYFGFWGPLLLNGNKPLDAEEAKARGGIEQQHPGITKMCRDVEALIFSKPDEHLVNLSHILDQTSDGVFLDQAHTNPIGNRIIAEHILKAIEPVQSHAPDNPAR